MYLLLGRLLRVRIGRGFHIQDDAHAIRLPLSECVAAVIYARSSSGLTLRALVEGWSWRAIKQRVARSAYQNDRPVATDFVDRYVRRIEGELPQLL